MGRTTKSRPTMEAGFLQLNKRSLKLLDDCLIPAELCYTAIKLLCAACYGRGIEGCLGPPWEPWSIRDIAACIGEPLTVTDRALRRLADIGFCECDEGHWRIPQQAYRLFVHE